MDQIQRVQPGTAAPIVIGMTYRSWKIIAIFIAVTALMSGAARDSHAHPICSKQACEKTRQKIAKIESKMRQGYRAPQGVKMEDELRRLRNLRSKQCR